jgi:hypothetical protein
VPIGARFMKQWSSNSDAREFSMPAGVVRIELCVKSSQAVTSSCRSQIMTPDGQFFNDTPSTYWEYFLESNLPRVCVVHQPF